MADFATLRLTEERKKWRQTHPAGFYAKPRTRADGSMDLKIWEVGIPGEDGTDWAGGLYKVVMTFPDDYPMKPPVCKFTPVIYHPNVFSCGTICLSILNEQQDWRSSITVTQIAQDLLNNPNPKSPANSAANVMFTKKPSDYQKKIRRQAVEFTPSSS